MWIIISLIQVTHATNKESSNHFPLLFGFKHPRNKRDRVVHVSAGKCLEKFCIIIGLFNDGFDLHRLRFFSSQEIDPRSYEVRIFFSREQVLDFIDGIKSDGIVQVTNTIPAHGPQNVFLDEFICLNIDFLKWWGSCEATSAEKLRENS